MKAKKHASRQTNNLYYYRKSSAVDDVEHCSSSLKPAYQLDELTVPVLVEMFDADVSESILYLHPVDTDSALFIQPQD